MTVPVLRERGAAELEHPSWCQVELCSLESVGAGGCHQREIVVVGDEGRKVASVLLRGYAAGRVTIGVVSWLRRGWLPREAELVAEHIVRAKALLDAAERVA